MNEQIQSAIAGVNHAMELLRSSSSPKTSFWRQIETAPKDGTRVDIWVPDWSHDGGRRFTDAWFSDGHWWYSSPEDADNVYSPDGGCHLHLSAVVTHWMPLPEPPNG